VAGLGAGSWVFGCRKKERWLWMESGSPERQAGRGRRSGDDGVAGTNSWRKGMAGGCPAGWEREMR